MYIDNDKLMLSDGEQCNDCMNYINNTCTTIQLVGLGFLKIVDDFTVDNCQFYKKKDKLRLIKE